jgi:hypothetical protein
MDLQLAGKVAPGLLPQGEIQKRDPVLKRLEHEANLL